MSDYSAVRELREEYMQTVKELMERIDELTGRIKALEAAEHHIEPPASVDASKPKKNYGSRQMGEKLRDKYISH
jgi:hypothetical protein